MLSICFWSCSTAVSLVASESDDTRETRGKSSQVSQIFEHIIIKEQRKTRQLDLRYVKQFMTEAHYSHSWNGAFLPTFCCFLPFFTGFLFAGVCWSEQLTSSRTPSSTHAPLNSMVGPVEWGCSNVDACNLSPPPLSLLSLSLSPLPPHTLPLISEKQGKTLKPFAGLTVRPQEFVCVWLQTLHVEGQFWPEPGLESRWRLAGRDVWSTYELSWERNKQTLTHLLHKCLSKVSSSSVLGPKDTTELERKRLSFLKVGLIWKNVNVSRCSWQLWDTEIEKSLMKFWITRFILYLSFQNLPSELEPYAGVCFGPACSQPTHSTTIWGWKWSRVTSGLSVRLPFYTNHDWHVAHTQKDTERRDFPVQLWTHACRVLNGSSRTLDEM